MSVMSPKGEWLDYTCEEWGNGAKIEFVLYAEPIPDEHPSDQAHLMITDAQGNRGGWLMNIEDMATLIRGLSRLMDNAIASHKPVSQDYEDHYDDYRKATGIK